MASVHFSVDHLCGYAQHFPLIPCGDLLSLNYAQKSMLCVIRWGTCFYHSSIAKTKNKQEFVFVARLAGCKKGGHFPSV